MSSVNGLTVNPNNLVAHRHFSSVPKEWIPEFAGMTTRGKEIRSRAIWPLPQCLSDSTSIGSTGRSACATWRTAKKGTNMKESPTILLIIEGRFFYPTMCMINKVLSSPIPRY
jgi:hypothetical protein